MERYLVFDAGCSTCSKLAEAVQEAADGKLRAVSIHGDEGKALLDGAYPHGWKHAPYLVVENRNGVLAWTGFGAAARLGLLMGPRKALRTWSLARRSGAMAPPGSKLAVAAGASRRRFLKAACATAGALSLLGLPQVSRVFACDSCNCCGAGGCGPCSSQVAGWTLCCCNTPEAGAAPEAERVAR